MEGVIAANLDAVRARIAAAARAAGRLPSSVALVAVGKTHPTASLRAALVAGHRLFGENRVQEAQPKYPALREAFPRSCPASDRAAPNQQGQGCRCPLRTSSKPSTGRGSRRRWPRRWSAPGAARPASSRSIPARSRRKPGFSLRQTPTPSIVDCRDRLGLPIRASCACRRRTKPRRRILQCCARLPGAASSIS